MLCKKKWQRKYSIQLEEIVIMKSEKVNLWILIFAYFRLESSFLSMEDLKRKEKYKVNKNCTDKKCNKKCLLCFFYWQLEMKPFLHNLITHLRLFSPIGCWWKKAISCTVMPPWKPKTRKKSLIIWIIHILWLNNTNTAWVIVFIFNISS